MKIILTAIKKNEKIRTRLQTHQITHEKKELIRKHIKPSNIEQLFFPRPNIHPKKKDIRKIMIHFHETNLHTSTKIKLLTFSYDKPTFSM